MPDFDKDLNPILLNKDSNPLNLPNPATPTPNRYANLSGTSLSPRGGTATDEFFGSGPVVSPMLPTVSAKELYDNRRYGKYDRGVVDIEDQNAYAQSGWDKAANGILKGLNLTATTVAGGFGTLYGMGKWATTGRFADIWDNEVLRGIDEYNNEVDQVYLPNYYTNKEKNASWYSTDNWLKANWLFDKLIKNSGYAVGAMVSGNIANAGLLRAGSLIGRAASATATAAEASQAFKLFTPLLRNTARAFSAGKNIEAAAVLEKELSSIADISTKASKLGELSMQTTRFAGVNDAARRTLISIYSAAGESSFEALQTANQYRESLIEQYKDKHAGETPTGADLEKINQQAEKVGKTSFLGNMALLGATEFSQLPHLLGSSYSSSRQAANSLLGRADDVLLKDGKYALAPKSTTKFGKLYDKVTGVGKYVFDPKEAAQEVGQYALQVGTQNYFNKAYQTNNADAWVDGFMYGLIGKDEKGEDVGALVSKEGIESGILGGITGGLMQARGTYLEQKARKSNTQTFIETLNNAPSFQKAFIDRRNALNRAVIINEQQQNAVMNGDRLEANDLYYDSMHNYLAPRVKYGRYDMVKEDIKELRQSLSNPNGIDVLKEQGVAGIEDTRESFLEKLDNFERSADYVNSLYKSLNLRYSGVLTEEGNRKYSPEVIDKMAYAASKIADYDVRIPMENAPLAQAGINTLEILDSIINEFSPNKAATQAAIDQINNMQNVISDKRDELKSALTNVIELSMRRKLFMEEFDQIKEKPEEFETPSEFDFGETEQLPVSVKQKIVPEGKKRKIIGEKELEVGKVYHLKQPMLKQQGNLIFDAKMAVLSQTLGGEYEVQMPDGRITFMRPEDFVSYDISEVSPVTPKLQEMLDEAIDAVLNKKKYSGLKKPTENKLDYINSLKDNELINAVEKEFNKRSAQYLKDLEEDMKRAEIMKKYKDQLQKTQEEIAKLSNGIPTGDDESDQAASNVFEDMKKIAQKLFTSTTHASEDWEKGQIPPHITRFIEFTNNLKKLRKKFTIKTMLVTSAQENLFGLDGLANLSFGSNVDKSLIVTKEQYDALSDEKKKEVVTNGFVGAVLVKEDKQGNRIFIDKDGNSIGKVGEIDPSTGAVKKIDLNKVVFSTMPAVNLFYSNGQPRYRAEEKEEATRFVAAWETYRKFLYDGDPKNFFVFDFGVSKGIPVINKESPEKNFASSVLIDDANRMNNEQFVYVSTKGEVAHDDGNNYRIPAGRPYFKNADDLTYLNNNKFSKKTATTIFAVLKEISTRINSQIEKGGDVSLNVPGLTDYIRDILFWYPKGGAAVNKLYIDESNMLHIGKKENGRIVESVYDFANIKNYEKEIINDLMNSYYNVNNKTLSEGLAKPFTEFYLDANNTLQKRVWSNYQTFLISGVNPDGSARSMEDTPLFTNISKPTPSVPYAFKQKYLFLLGIELPVEKKPVKKETKDTIGDYKFDGSVNQYTSKELIDLPDYYEFTATETDTGKLEVETAPTEHNDELIEKINKDSALKERMRQVLRDAKFAEKTITSLGDDVDFVEVALPTIVSIHIKKLKKATITPSQPEVAPPPPPPSPAPETPPAPEGKFDLGGINDDVPFRKVGELGKQVERMTDAEMEYFKEFVKDKLPGIPYEFIENLVRVNGTDEEAWGVFEDGVAKVYKRAAKGTAFHEIMEGVWLGFLSPEQQQALLNEMRSKKGSFIDRASGRRIDYSEATNLELKERIMDDAAEYYAGKIPAKSITGKILQFFKAIIDFFKHWIGNPSLKEQLFRDIERGKYKTYIFPEEKKTALPQYAEIEGLSEQKANDFVQDMSARVFQEIFKNEESLFEIEDSIRKLDVFNFIKQRYTAAGVFNTMSEETYGKLVKRTKEFLIKFGIEFDEENVISFNDDNRTKDGYAADAFSVNFKKSSPYAVKLLVATLVKAERRNSPIGELLNMPGLDTKESSINGYTLVPYGKTWSTLMNKLSNVRDVPTFINKLYELAKENPDYVRLYTRLGGDVTSPFPKINFDKFKDHNWRLFVSFYQAFTKQKPDGFIQYIDEGDVYTASANQASLVKQIAREWTENLKLSIDDPESIVKLNEEKGVYYVDKSSEKWKKTNISSPQGMVEFLSNIGIDFPIEAYNRIQSSKLKNFADAVGGIKTALNKSDVLMNVSGKELNMRGNVETLSALYVAATSPVEDSTFFNNKGQRQQSFTEANYPSFFESVINSVETLSELKEKFPQVNDVFSTNSIFLKPGGPLFDEDENRRSNTDVKVEYILGDKNINKNKGSSISQLTLGKRTTLEINQNIRGSYYLIIAGDGSTEWMLNLGNTFSFQEMQSYDEDQKKKVYDVFKGYLRDEIALIGDAATRSKIKNIGTKAKELRFFKAFLSEGMIEKVETLAQKKDLTKEDVEAFFETNDEKINEEIQAYITKVADRQKDTLLSENEIVRVGSEGKFKYNGLDKIAKKLGINKYNLTEKDVNDLMRFLTINYMVNTIEYHKVLFGDPYQFKIKKDGNKVVIDETKRIKSFLSPRRITVNFGLLNNWLNDELNTVEGIKLTNKDFGYHQHKDYAKTFTATDVKIVGSTYENDPAYENTDEADASSWMNPGAYREVKWKNGQWSPQAEAFHQWEMAYARQTLSSKGRYTYPKGEKGNRLYEHDAKLIATRRPNFIIEVMKPVATGNKFGKNYIDQHIDKTSTVPIYYSAVEGRNLEELYIKMFEEGYDYVIVESGRKEGTEQTYNLYKPNGVFNDERINNTIEVSWDSYGIQQENSYGEKKLQTRGSQLTKLATIDLYSDGEPTGSTPERKKVIKEAVERNNTSLKQLIENGYQNLLKKLTIEDLGYSFKVTDNVKVSELLKKEFLKRDMSFNTLDAFLINKETGEFEVPFEASVNYKQIKDLLYSMVDKAVGSPKMNGFPAVQVSATMWENAKEGRQLVEKVTNADGTFSYKKITRAEYEKLSDDRKKNIRFTSSTLKFYEDKDGKRHCEIMIPNWFGKEMRRRLGRDMSKEEFTEFLNTEEGRKVLTGVGFRIPTQGLNSVEVFVVKGFLPEYMGRTVVVPSEITTKAGSDFDIDKLNLYLKNVYVTPKGDILEVPFFGYGEEAKAKMSDFLLAEDLKEMADISEDVLDVEREEDDYETLAEKMYTQSLENEYYNSLIELLTLPENFSRLITPNSSKELEDIADDLSTLRNEIDNPNAMATLLDRSEMTKLRQIFVMAKQWVGRAAVNNTAHALFQKTVMHVKFPFKMTLPHNTTQVNGEDRLSFSNTLDRAGKYISDTLSMFTNSFVDVVKNPYIMKIIYSDRIVGTFMMLTRAGVPRKTMALFMNQPIIREYVKELDARGASVFNIDNFTVERLIKSKFPAKDDVIKAQGTFAADDKSLETNISVYTEGKLSPQQNAQQHLILKEFKSYFNLASDLFKISMAINYDTTSFRNAEDLYTKGILTEVAEETNMICCPEKVLDSSHLGTMRNRLDRSSSALGTFLKFNNPEFRDILESVFDEYARNTYLSGDNRTKVAEKLTASFLDYIIQIKRPFDIKDLVVSANSVADRLNAIRTKHPEVRILKDLVVVSSNTPGGAKTVTLRVNTKDAYDEDLYVGYMREMRNNPATRDLYEDLVRLAIIQGNYFSAVSIKNIIPSEDYMRIVAPVINTLKIDGDIMAFTKNKMFQRNSFKDENVVGKGAPKFYITEDRDEDDSMYIVGFDSEDIEVYQYSTKAFPEIVELGLGRGQRKMFYLSPKTKGANNSVMVIPRILSVGESKIDFVSGMSVTRAMYSERKAKGDRTIYDVYGYKRVEEADGTPFMTEDGYYVYKQINLVGDGQLATEHSVYPRQSVINNNTVKIEDEIPDEDIIHHLTLKSMASTPTPIKEPIAFNPFNLNNILSGKKTSTLRIDMEADSIGIPAGQTKKIMIGGKLFNVTNRGKMNVTQAGGKAAMVRSEGLPTKPDENNKYIVEVDGVKYYTASTQAQSWMNGTGADLYVYNIQPVSPAEQEAPAPTSTSPTTPVTPTGKPDFDKLPSKSPTPTMTYAGIGSRQTPPEILARMTQVAKELEGKGYTLNTGVTFGGKEEGADAAFSRGTKNKNLFAPEKASEREIKIAKEIHPNPSALSPGAMKLMARNTNQVFGNNLDTPVDFVLFYAKEGKGIRPEGGTGQAVEMARLKGIPTINMANTNWREQLDRVLSTTPVVAPVSVGEIQTPVPGVANIPNSGLTVEKANEFIDLLQPQIKKQAYVENRARTANMMFSFGLRWAKNIPNESEKSEQAKNLGQPRPNKKQIKSKEGATYGYYLTDQNNNSLPSIKELQPIMDFIQSKLGIDMSNYDAMLGNIYDQSSFIHQHRDTTESITAEGYPVIVINLGADGHLEYDKDLKSTYASYKKSGQLDLTNGGIYAFGVDGVNRFTFHHRIGSGLESENPLKPITLPNGQILSNYRITLTFRRASDLDAGMPKTPNKLVSTTTPITEEPITPVEVPTVKIPISTIDFSDKIKSLPNSVYNDRNNVGLFLDVIINTTKDYRKGADINQKGFVVNFSGVDSKDDIKLTINNVSKEGENYRIVGKGGQGARAALYNFLVSSDGNIVSITSTEGKTFTGETYANIYPTEELRKSIQSTSNKELMMRLASLEKAPSTESTTLPTLEIGRYVKYKEGTYIVVKLNTNGTIQIYNPTLEGSSAKISVSEKNLSPLDNKAAIVQYRDGEYIVTPKNTIISLTTNKIIKWGDDNGDRKAVLTLARKQIASEVKEKVLTFSSSFSAERQQEIINNFASKHNISKEQALKNIEEAIASREQDAINQLKECY